MSEKYIVNLQSLFEVSIFVMDKHYIMEVTYWRPPR